MNLRAHCLAQLVRENESRLVLAVEIPAQLQGAMPLRSVCKDRDGQQVVTVRQFPRVKKRSARGAELSPAFFAAPDRAATKAVKVEAAAVWAVGLSAIIGPADFNELRQGFLIRHTRNGAQ